MHRRALTLMLTALAGFTSHGAFATVVEAAMSREAVYTAMLGTLPDEQGWVRAGAGAAAAWVIDGRLVQTTLPFVQSTNCSTFEHADNALVWQRDDLPFDFDAEVTMRVTLRVVSSQEGLSCQCDGGLENPTAGITILLVAEDGRVLRLQIRDGEVGLVTGATTGGLCENPGPWRVSVDVDLGSNDREFRLEVRQGVATLYLDGAMILTLPVSDVVGAAGPLVYFGDETVWANSEFKLSSIAVAATACPADIDGDAVVGFSDILSILVAFGPCADGCAADLDGDGQAGFTDLLVVLAAFGDCGV